VIAAEQVEKIFRAGHVPAALISQFEDFDLAEDAPQDALVNALERWEKEKRCLRNILRFTAHVRTI
jgi:predicted RNA polymerase sigma factor